MTYTSPLCTGTELKACMELHIQEGPQWRPGGLWCGSYDGGYSSLFLLALHPRGLLFSSTYASWLLVSSVFELLFRPKMMCFSVEDILYKPEDIAPCFFLPKRIWSESAFFFTQPLGWLCTSHFLHLIGCSWHMTCWPASENHPERQALKIIGGLHGKRRPWMRTTPSARDWMMVWWVTSSNGLY